MQAAGPRIVRPNLGFINHLRYYNEKPSIHVSERPGAIRNFVVANDYIIGAVILAGIIAGRVETLTGKTTNISSLSAAPEICEEHNIFTAVTEDETARVTKYVLKPEMEVDMLFTDSTMIGITGENITRGLRMRGYNGYIIGVTAEGPSNIESFYLANADLVISKPYEADTVKNMLIDVSV